MPPLACGVRRRSSGSRDPFRSETSTCPLARSARTSSRSDLLSRRSGPVGAGLARSPGASALSRSWATIEPAGACCVPPSVGRPRPWCDGDWPSVTASSCSRPRARRSPATQRSCCLNATAQSRSSAPSWKRPVPKVGRQASSRRSWRSASGLTCSSSLDLQASGKPSASRLAPGSLAPARGPTSGLA